MQQTQANNRHANLWQTMWGRNWTAVATAILGALAGLIGAEDPMETPAGESPSAEKDEPVPYMIIVTGGELLEGAYVDSHTAFLTRTLRPLGFRCVGSMVVDDKVADVQNALRFATARASLIIVTGGLGPTDNDITREALSQFTGIPLKEDPEVLARLAQRFGVPPDQLRSNLRIQTQVPVRGTYLKNAQGTAVGLVFDTPSALIVALPGPPRELEPMVRQELVPYLSKRLGTHTGGCSLTLRFVGLGQSEIDKVLDEHVPLPDDVTVSSQFQGLRVDFTFAFLHDRPEDRKRLEAIKQKILEHLGDSVYAEDAETTLEDVVIGQLASRDDTLVVAETGSGGSLAAGLTAADGVDRVLAGAYVATSDEKLRRLLQLPDDKWTACGTDAERAELLARTARERTASRWAVAITEARGGGVQVAIQPPSGPAQIRRLDLSDTSPEARFRLTTRLLVQLRQLLR